MRSAAMILMLFSATIHADVLSRRSPLSPGATSAACSVLLDRLGGLSTYSSFSANNQRSLLVETAASQMQTNMIYYSSLTLPASTANGSPAPFFTITPSGELLGGVTHPGDNGVITGGGGGGSAFGSDDVSNLIAVPAPGAAALGFMGVFLVACLRRRRSRFEMIPPA